MRVTYDSVADAAYVQVVEQIGNGEAVKNLVTDLPTQGGSIVIDFDDDGRVLGFEILGARTLLRDET